MTPMRLDQGWQVRDESCGCWAFNTGLALAVHIRRPRVTTGRLPRVCSWAQAPPLFRHPRPSLLLGTRAVPHAASRYREKGAGQTVGAA